MSEINDNKSNWIAKLFTDKVKAILGGNFNSELIQSIEQIDLLWDDVLCTHKRSLKLVILAEAPLSSSKYFYKAPGSFLDSLRRYYAQKRTDSSIKNKNLPQIMHEEGILLMDIYAFPIPSVLYRQDKNNDLFNDAYLASKIAKLKASGLINDSTVFVFRYKSLIKRGLANMPSLRGLNILKNKEGQFVSLNCSEKPQLLHSIIEELLD